jgi:hypothetical protein
MNRWDERPDDVRRARLDLIKALHRKSLLELDEAKPDARRPPLPEEMDAAWDAPSGSR